MRKLFTLAVMAALAVSVGAARDADAGVTIDLQFVEKNGVAIAPVTAVTATAGDTLVMEILAINDERLLSLEVGLEWDTDVPNNELDLVKATEWTGFVYMAGNSTFFNNLGAGPCNNAFQESDGTQKGICESWENQSSVGTSAPIFNTNYVIGTVVWVVNAPITDGQDIFVIPGAIVNSGNGNIVPSGSYNGATVNAIPEPGTASLLGLGLVGLILAGRRSRA